jgi:hypothetical protein
LPAFSFHACPPEVRKKGEIMEPVTVLLIGGAVYLLFQAQKAKAQTTGATEQPPVASSIPPVMVPPPNGGFSPGLIDAPTPIEVRQTVESIAVSENPPVVVQPYLQPGQVTMPGTSLPYSTIWGPVEPYDRAGIEAGTATHTPEDLRQLVDLHIYDRSVIDHYWHWMQVWVARRTDPAYAGTWMYAPTTYDPFGGPEAFLARTKAALEIQ